MGGRRRRWLRRGDGQKVQSIRKFVESSACLPLNYFILPSWCPLSSLPGLGGVFKAKIFKINKFLTDFFSLRSTTIVAKSYNQSCKCLQPATLLTTILNILCNKLTRLSWTFDILVDQTFPCLVVVKNCYTSSNILILSTKRIIV